MKLGHRYEDLDTSISLLFILLVTSGGKTIKKNKKQKTLKPLGSKASKCLLKLYSMALEPGSTRKEICIHSNNDILRISFR